MKALKCLGCKTTSDDVEYRVERREKWTSPRCSTCFKAESERIRLRVFDNEKKSKDQKEATRRKKPSQATLLACSHTEDFVNSHTEKNDELTSLILRVQGDKSDFWC
jgi:hypothetical protein